MSESSAPKEFVDALLSLRESQVDPSLTVREVPAPQRLAPFAAAIEVSTSASHRDESLGSSTLVVLYDPDQDEVWGGPFRLVGHARMQIDPDQSTDALLGEVIWQTVSDSLDQAGAGFDRMVGSVTRELTETFGGLSIRGSSLNAELRCSWSPNSGALAEHLTGWADALRQNCGLEPTGVIAISSIRG